ncbi:MAG TPA: endonuclease/exonuclease/phosphatase family protein [Bacteroidales bacterium]|nr:endonuclease/exonuclease/phosphatase family protein [Bacteroidales bacterium]HPT01642.1 endonuclease/exonuclease/phosphatase family protein [Bacteroidales bacterium]
MHLESQKSNKKKRSFGTGLTLFLNWIVVLFLLLAYLSRYISPETFWPLAFFGLFYPVILIINIFFILFWLVYLKRYFLISLIAILLGYSYLISFFSIGNHHDKTGDSEDIKVMSYNVRLFNLYGWKGNTHREMRKAIFDLIKTESPDILCIQEYYSGKGLKADYADTITKAINTKYGFAAFIESEKKDLPVGLATFSKYPILHSHKILFENSDVNFCIVNDIIVHSDTIRVLNAHLESVRLGKEDFSLVTEWNSLNDPNKDYNKGSRIILRKIKSAFARRSKQIPALEEIINSSPYPVVFCGDINDTPVSYAYQKLTRSLNDAFVMAGNGIGQTYAEVLPFLRIDYILTSKSISVNDFYVIGKPYSDHYPIMARIKPGSHPD